MLRSIVSWLFGRRGQLAIERSVLAEPEENQPLECEALTESVPSRFLCVYSSPGGTLFVEWIDSSGSFNTRSIPYAGSYTKRVFEGLQHSGFTLPYGAPIAANNIVVELVNSGILRQQGMVLSLASGVTVHDMPFNSVVW